MFLNRSSFTLRQSMLLICSFRFLPQPILSCKAVNITIITIIIIIIIVTMIIIGEVLKNYVCLLDEIEQGLFRVQLVTSLVGYDLQ